MQPEFLTKDFLHALILPPIVSLREIFVLLIIYYFACIDDYMEDMANLTTLVEISLWNIVLTHIKVGSFGEEFFSSEFFLLCGPGIW